MEILNKDKKPKSKKLPDDFDARSMLPPELRDDKNIVIEDPRMIEMAVIARANEQEYELQRRLREQEQKQKKILMEQQEKKNRERRKRQQENIRGLGERQLEMFFTGNRFRCSYCHDWQHAEWLGHTSQCPMQRSISIEPGLSLLSAEYSTGRIIRLDEQTHSRLVEFALPDETGPEAQRSGRSNNKEEALQIKKVSANSDNTDSNDNSNDNAVVEAQEQREEEEQSN
jgi:DNA replication protein DnaC